MQEFFDKAAMSLMQLAFLAVMLYVIYSVYVIRHERAERKKRVERWNNYCKQLNKNLPPELQIHYQEKD